MKRYMPSGGDKMTGEQCERFLSKLNVGSDDECWLWSAGTFPEGYGCFRLNGRMHLSHRIAYEWQNGEIPEGMCVCHACDVKACCNPAHLFLGTHRENMMDMFSKGYRVPARGERHWKARLTADQVKAMREKFAAGVSRDALQEEYQIKRDHLNAVLSRRLWKCVG